MEHVNLKSYALMCECAGEVARFGILLDFLKKGVTDFYSYKSKNETLPADEMEIFYLKYAEFKAFFEKVLNKPQEEDMFEYLNNEEVRTVYGLVETAKKRQFDPSLELK